MTNIMMTGSITIEGLVIVLFRIDLTILVVQVTNQEGLHLADEVVVEVVDGMEHCGARCIADDVGARNGEGVNRIAWPASGWRP
jgi:hypothetical protein